MMSDKPKYRFDPTEPGRFVQDYDLVDYPNLLNPSRIQEMAAQTGKSIAMAAMMREHFSDMEVRILNMSVTSRTIPASNRPLLTARILDELGYRRILRACNTDHNIRYSHVPIEYREYGYPPVNAVTQELRQCYGFKAPDRVPLVLKPLP